MLMDKVTEMVAHLIGIFETTLEEERMRDAYEKFKALKKADPDNDPLAAQSIVFKAKYSLEGFTPKLQYADPGIEAVNAINSPFYPAAFYPLLSLPAIAAAPPDTLSHYAQVWAAGAPIFKLEPASSVVVISIQSAFLNDDDVLLLGNGDAQFIDPGVFLAQQQQLQLIATAIAAPVSSEVIHPGETATENAIALHDQIAQAEATPIAGVAATMLHGAEAFGKHVNGESVEDMPVLDDLWPDFLAEDEAEEAPAEGSTGTYSVASDDTAQDAEPASEHVFPDPFEGLSGAQDSESGDAPWEEGHGIVTGANTLVNEVYIASGWLDAPVFSVMGDVVNLDVIAQVNVLMDIDYGTFGQFVASTVMNAAALGATATTPDPDDDAEAADQPGDDPTLPAHWAVTRIDGDLIQMNQVQQYSFVTDTDRAEVTLQGADAFIGMGENTVFNLTDLTELGYGYDLIVVGGSMISVNWISQVNVMLDNDMMTFDGVTTANFGGGDNLLFNAASINSVGVDTYGQMQADARSVGESLADGDTDLPRSVAQDSVFEGIDVLRVLYVEGDLTTINWIEQTNVLGDADQVHLARNDLETATGATATVTTGSNATINIAAIDEFGIDSAVAVNGDVYDDALLYQAELVDTNADPLGVDLSALATEAVAFLADDMIGPETGPADAPIAATRSEGTTPDVMQTMLA